MKLAVSLFICLMVFSSIKETPEIDRNTFSVDIGSYDLQDLERYHFENFDYDVKQQIKTTFYKRVSSYDGFMLFMDNLREDTEISAHDYENIEGKLTHLHEDFFEENALIVAFLNTATTPYYYDCENISIEDDSIVVTLNVSGWGDCEAEQNTFVFIETEQFSSDLSVKIRYVYE